MLHLPIGIFKILEQQKNKTLFTQLLFTNLSKNLLFKLFY
ncbi:hypothetical protein P23_0276 [Acinetobacter calcoaceticus]|nr:hypothetical protein P23_0276 [Acinetobacter calcoaceticus]